MAITTVEAAPHIYSPAYNPIAWSFLSDKADEQDMKYVIDIYVYGATGYSHRIKQRPNPQGYCIVDVSAIIQPYISLAEFNNEFGYLYNTPIRANTNENFFGSPDSDIYTYITVKAGEEYTVNGTPTIFDGNGATGAPDYVLGSREYFDTVIPGDDTIRILPIALPAGQGIANQANTNPYGIFDPYIPLASSGFANPLTTNPGDNIVQDGDFHTLTYLNWQDFGSGYDQVLYGWLINFYTNDGTLIGTTPINNILTNGGGPQANTSYTSVTYDPDFTLLSLKCGPAISQIIPSASWNACDYYTVNARIKTATSPTTIWEGPTVKFVKSTDCQDLYPRVRLSFLNKFGARDYYNFTKFYEKTTQTQTDTWSQSMLDWSGTSPYGQNTEPASALGSWTWLRGGELSVNRTTTTTYRVQSDWVTQEQMDFLGGIAESPQVWAYIGNSGSPVVNGTVPPVTVKITNLNYSYKLIKQVKLAQVSFDMTYTKIDQKQNIS